MSQGSVTADQYDDAPESRPRRAESGALQALYQYRYLVFLWVAVGVAAGVAYWSYAGKWYESSARVLLLRKDARTVTTTGGATSPDTGIEDETLADHVEVLQSHRIVSAALEKDGLTDLPSIAKHLDETQTTADFVIDHLRISTGGQGPARSARVINVAFRHTDPVDAEKVLSSILREYRIYLNEKFENVAQEAVDLIADAQGKAELQLRTAEDQLATARKAAPLLAGSVDGSNVHITRVQTLETQLAELRLKLGATRERQKNALIVLKTLEATGVSPIEKLAVIDGESLDRLVAVVTIQSGGNQAPEVMKTMAARTETAKLMFSALLELQAKEKTLLAEFGPNHPDVMNVRNQIDLTEAFVKENAPVEVSTGTSLEELLKPDTLVATYMRFLSNDIQTMSAQETELVAAMDKESASAKVVQVFADEDKRLQNALERKQTLFDTVVDQLREVNMAKSYSGFIHELIQTPKVGEEVWPSLPVSLLAGMMLGLVMGSGNAIVNFSRRKFFENSEEIEDLTNTRVLAEVPQMRLTAKAQGEIDPALSRLDPTLSVALAQFSHGSESIRHMRTLVTKALPEDHMVFGVTSAVPGDGKSTVTANLAASLALRGKRVLLVDADMRRPRQHKLFGCGNEIGLAGVLGEGLPIEDAAFETPVPDLYLMASGRVTGDPGDLLDRTDFAELTTRMLAVFDVVIFDLPPVLAVADPCIVARQIEKMIVVVRPAADDRRQAVSTIDKLRSVGADVLGIAVNCWDTTGSGYFNRAYESSVKYGYGKYGGYNYNSNADAKPVSNGNGANGHGANGNGAGRNGSPGTRRRSGSESSAGSPSA